METAALRQAQGRLSAVQAGSKIRLNHPNSSSLTLYFIAQSGQFLRPVAQSLNHLLPGLSPEIVRCSTAAGRWQFLFRSSPVLLSTDRVLRQRQSFSRRSHEHRTEQYCARPPAWPERRSTNVSLLNVRQSLHRALILLESCARISGSCANTSMGTLTFGSTFNSARTLRTFTIKSCKIAISVSAARSNCFSSGSRIWRQCNRLPAAACLHKSPARFLP